MTPEDFPRHFAAAFAAHDLDRMADLFQRDATFGSLTGLWAETPEAIRAAFEGEMAGIFNNARLVTGKGTLRDLTPEATLLRQRYTISGAQDETGTELPRFAAILVAVLELGSFGWQVQCLTFSALA
jgi:uncharacterized protein (TIGR02246 family)